MKHWKQRSVPAGQASALPVTTSATSLLAAAAYQDGTSWDHLGYQGSSFNQALAGPGRAESAKSGSRALPVAQQRRLAKQKYQSRSTSKNMFATCLGGAACCRQAPISSVADHGRALVLKDTASKCNQGALSSGRCWSAVR